jgi:RNA polymerase sigma factor (sigma-70 family)
MRENSKRHSREETGSEQDQLASFQRGEEEGFTYYFNKFYGALLFLAFRKINDRPKAEDLVEGVFIKIWLNHGAFTSPKTIKSWLYTRIRLDCEDWLMQQIELKHNKSKRKKGSKQGPPKMSEDVRTEVIRAETTRRLHAAMERLPTACGQIFRMLRINGKTVKEIAGELQFTPKTIRDQIRRAGNILRKQFPDERFGDI